jgi:pimeloyl-ACP methyl ester carboxylesterase
MRPVITRRHALSVTAAAAMAAPGLARERNRGPFTYVLIHGAWHGGWCWREVRRILLDEGHEVFTPTMTGLGERVHLRSPGIDIGTHTIDIANVIEWEELENVVLVGHSYGGAIVSTVCDRMKARIAHAIYLDAIVPRPGETVLPGGSAAAAEERFGPLQEGYLAMPRDTAFGIPASMAAELAWIRRRLTPHLLGTWTRPVVLRNGGSDGIRRSFIYCSDKPALSAEQRARLDGFRNDPTWQYRELPCGHDAMVILPAATARLFVDIAAGA